MVSTTFLRSYNPSFDAAYLPILIRSHTLGFIEYSNIQFFKHPIVLALLTSVISLLLYQLFHVFENHLLMPLEAELVASGGRNWQDYVALGIYAVPPLAAVIGLVYGTTIWYHRKFWNKVAGREVQQEDIALNVKEYYGEEEKGSGFWVLEFENELVACFGIDGRSPGKQLDLVETEEINAISSNAALELQEKGAEEEEENVQDLALLSQANTLNGSNEPTAPIVPAPIEKRELSRYAISGNPSPALTGFADSPSTVQLRHYAISENYASSPNVSSHVLELALRTAFSPSTSSKSVERVIMVVIPDVQKELRQAALEKGFQVSGRKSSLLGRERLPVNFEARDNVFSSFAQRILGAVWPLNFEREVLVIDRQTFEGQGK